MRKTKIFTAVLLVIVLLVSASCFVLAAESDDAKSVLDNVAKGAGSTVNTGTIQNFGGAIVKVAQVIGIVVAVVVILVLGIKYLVGSAEERAEYKKTFVPYIIGAILVFAATTIVNIVYELSTSLKV